MEFVDLKRSFLLLLMVVMPPITTLAQPFLLDRLSYVGGSAADRTVAVRIDADGKIVIGGMTTSTDFPTTSAAFQRTPTEEGNGTITIIDTAGRIEAATYLGSDEDDALYDIEIEPSGTVLAVLETDGDTFPVTGGLGTVVDPKRTIVVRLSADLSQVLAAFHLKIDHSFEGCRIDWASDGRIVVVGTTEEDAFPTTSNAAQSTFAGEHDAVVCVLDASLSTLLYATYLGGDDHDTVQAATFDTDGNIHVALNQRRYVVLGPTYTVLSDVTSASTALISTSDLVATPTSVIACNSTTTGASLTLRSFTGTVTTTFDVSSSLDHLVGGMHDTSGVLIVGTKNNSGRAALISLTNGTMVWSHDIGGSGGDTCMMARRAKSGLVMAGSTSSNDLPTTPNAAQRTTRDAAGSVLDHWFARSTTSAPPPPPTVLSVTPLLIRMDSVVIHSQRTDSITCSLLSGTAAIITRIDVVPAVVAVTVTPQPPLTVTSSTPQTIYVSWTPNDTTALSTTVQIVTADTTIIVELRGTVKDTTSPPPPPPRKPRVTLYDVNLGEIDADIKATATMAVRIDSVTSLTFDSMVVAAHPSVQIERPSFPRAAIVPNDQFVIGVMPSRTGRDSAMVTVFYSDSTAKAVIRWSVAAPPPPPKKPVVTLQSVDLGVVVRDVAVGVRVAMQIDSVTSLLIDSVTIASTTTARLTGPTYPRNARIPRDTITLELTPSKIGADSLVVTVHYADSSASATVAWLVLQPGSAQWSTADVDLDTIVIGDVDSTTIYVRNVGSEEGEIRDVALTSDANGDITIDHASLPTTVAPGAVFAIRVHVAPLLVRTVDVRCVITTDDDGNDDDTLSARITYRSVKPPPDPVKPIRIAVDSHAVKVGDQFTVNVICREGGEHLRTLNVRSATLQLTYRRTVLTVQSPLNGSVISDPSRKITVTSDLVMTSDTVARIVMTACLGDADSSELVVNNVVFNVDTGDISLDTAVRGLVKIIDPGSTDNPRTVSRDTTMPAIEIYPNPTPDVATLSLHACTPTATVMVHSVDGRFVFEWRSTLTEGQRDVHITLPSGMTPGMYVCTYRSNDIAVYRSFMVLR